MEDTDHSVLIPRHELRGPGEELRSRAYALELGSGAGSQKTFSAALFTVHMLKKEKKKQAMSLKIYPS